MRIVHLVWSLNYGGVETMLVNIANTQNSLGAEVNIVVLNNMYESAITSLLNPEIRVYIGKRAQNSKNPLLIKWVNSVLESINPEIIHTHSSKIIGLLEKKYQQKSVTTLHDMPYGLISNKYLPHFITHKFLLPNLWGTNNSNVGSIDQYRRVYSISKSVKQQLSEKYGIESDLIYNGILTSSFKTRDLTLPKSSFRIVQVGRVVCQKKGHDLMVEAIEALPENVIIDFIGDGPDLNMLRDRAEKIGISSRINWLGNQTQDYIKANLKNYDLFVQPSRFEGFGLTVTEAMAAKVPVLVSSGEGPEEIIQGQKYGWTFKNGSVESLIQVIQEIRLNYDTALNKATQAYEFVKSNFDVSVTASKYLKAYQIIVGNQ